MTLFSFLGRLLGGPVFEKSGFEKTGIGPEGIGRWPWKNRKKTPAQKTGHGRGFYTDLQRANLWTQLGGRRAILGGVNFQGLFPKN